MPPTSNGTARGGPATSQGEEIPIASRLAQIGEFVEVAHRIGGTGAAIALAEKRAGSQFDPDLAAAHCANAGMILEGSTPGHTWDAVIGAEPALGVLLSEAEFDRAFLAIADFVDLKSPYTLGHARAVSKLAAETGAKLGMAARRSRRCAGRAWPTTLGVSASPTPSGTSAVRSGLANGSGCACTRI